MVVSVSALPIWGVAKIVRNQQLQNTSQIGLHAVTEHVMTS